MRPVKFRAWDIRSKIMVGDVGVHPISMNSEDDQRFIVMQYTGLKDENGQEIYEGDIVHIGGHDGVVKFKKARFIVDADPIFQLEDCCEIIGNIYENPELLK